MSGETRWMVAVKAAKKILDTLTSVDYVSVVLFSTAAEHWQPVMKPATAENKELAKQWIDSRYASGETYFQSGFDKVGEIFSNSYNGEAGSHCTKVVLFLTDGQDTTVYDPTKKSQTPAQLMSTLDTVMQQVESVGTKKKAHLFTYSFGSGAGDAANIPKQLACAHDGAWTAIQDGG